ncbi:hypothetical protein Psi01_52820 [Planobispora siamensis]|uniref:DUF4351 domain-containing protein n=1 Tax=Planobispora siamensis TaxID=936338 RepID=A0A8J3WNM6_9ACTN|nr:hypothetical protein Psi01_52820 [Planobispora siamensis]
MTCRRPNMTVLFNSSGTTLRWPWRSAALVLALGPPPSPICRPWRHGPRPQPQTEEITTSTDWPVYSPFARAHYGRGLEKGKTEGKAEGKAEGRAEEAVRLLLLMLEARGEVPDEVRARITACTDLAQLEAWALAVATGRTVHDMFGGPGGEDR